MSRTTSGKSPFLVAAACLCLLNTLSFATQPRHCLTHHLRAAVRNHKAKRMGKMAGNQVMTLNIVLPLRDQSALDRFLKVLYDPSSPSYRQFLTVPQFTDRFGPSQQDYEAVLKFAKKHKFSIIGGSRDGMNVVTRGSVSTVEKALHVKIESYRHTTENRTFYAPDREPTVDLPFSLWHISGLDNYSIPKPRLITKSAFAKAHGLNPDAVLTHAMTGSGPSASFLGSDMRAAYYGGTALTGAGQNLGLLEYAGTDLDDLTTYYKNVGQTNNVPITLLSTDGTSTACLQSDGCDDSEQTIDMTQVLGMAPGLASLVLYIGSTDTAIISAMTTHNPLPTTIGCSWGWTPADPNTLDPYFKKMAAQGQTFFAASGDNSTWSSSNEAWPADDANVVSVGGTDLITASAAGPWQSETAWANSGGGVSPDSIPIPSWQQLSGVINSSNQGSTTFRNGPDVAANANFTFYVCAGQTTCAANQLGGTSFAAPMWAGYLALANQRAAADGNPPVGFINPAIYAQNVTAGYAADFHDVASGTSGSFSAAPGYDLVTGWGSPNGSELINALTTTTNAPGFRLSASSPSEFLTLGKTSSVVVTIGVSAGFSSTIALSAVGAPAGVHVSFSPSFVNAPGRGSSQMILSVSRHVTAGTYPITITAMGAGISHTVTLNFTVRH
jgi:subtilase family serine protease